MEANGDIYLDKYAGWYSVRDEAYYDESETQAQRQGAARRAAGHAGRMGRGGELFLPALGLSGQAARALRAAIRITCCRASGSTRSTSFVKGGLQDLSISRTTFDWGVPVPGDPKHVMYVWVDALTNYITAVGYPDTDSEKFRRYWPADLHVIGKDIVRFHAVYWPAFLMSAGVAVPRRIFSHGFLFNRGEKMSKSVGNVIDPFALANAYGVDPLRYFFLREVPFGQDGNYSHEAIVNRINADLANDLGNLAQRSLSMVARKLRRRAAEAGGVQRRRPGDPRRRRRHDRQGARRHGDAATAPGAQRRLGRGRRRQPLFRRRGALGARQDRSGAAGHGALRDRGGVAADRDPGAAVHAGIGGEAARSAGGAGDERDVFRSSAASIASLPAPSFRAPAPVFPRYVEAEAPAAQ